MTRHGPAVLAEGLTKTFGKTHARRRVHLAADAGTVRPAPNPNVAGKTAIRILTIPRDGGR